MSSNTNKYGTNIHSRDFIVIPITSLDIPIEVNNFQYTVLDENGEPTGSTDYYSINEYCTAYNRKLMLTTDGLYCFLGLNLSDLKNEKKSFKDFAKAAGLKLGGEDFTSIVGDEFWVLTANELDEWLAISLHNISIEEI